MATATPLPLIQTPFGHACPPAPGHSPDHAITVHIPSWQTILDFMELKPEFFASLKNMYPRMMPMSPVVQLSDQVLKALNAAPDTTCVLFPTRFTAEACKAFATSPAREEAQIQPENCILRPLLIRGCLVYAVMVPTEGQGAAFSYRRNAGICISTRHAAYLSQGIDTLKEVDMDTEPPTTPNSTAHVTIQERIAGLIDRAPLHVTGRRPTGPADVYLFETGMASIYYSHQYIRKTRDGTAILFNFAFHSTPHALEDYSSGYKFFGKGTEYDELETFVRTEIEQGRRVQSLLTEFPANPLVTSVDLDRLRALANEYDFVLIVDDTIGTFANVDLFGPGGADVLVTSLSKSFSGYADLLAGSAVLNPSSQHYAELKPLFDDSYTNQLFVEDAEILESNSRDYLHRQDILNKTGAALAEHLHQRSLDPNGAIAKVWYPVHAETRNNFTKRMRPPTADFTPGYGFLLTVELRTNVMVRAWYEYICRLLHAGPHLGAHFTLILPYCKGIYGKDLAGVEAFALNERQIRVSVGLEDAETLIATFDEAEKVAQEAEAEVNKLPPPPLP